MAPDGDSGGKKKSHTQEKKIQQKSQNTQKQKQTEKKLAARDFPSHLLPV